MCARARRRRRRRPREVADGAIDRRADGDGDGDGDGDARDDDDDDDDDDDAVVVERATGGEVRTVARAGDDARAYPGLGDLFARAGREGARARGVRGVDGMCAYA